MTRILTTALFLVALAVPPASAASTDRPAASMRGPAATDPGRDDRGKPDREKPKKKAHPNTVEDVELLEELPTVDPTLAAVAEELVSTDEQATLRVLVFGDAVDGAIDEFADLRRALDGGAASVRVPVHALYELATQPGVSYLALDIPVRPASSDPALQPTASFSLVDEAPFAWSVNATGIGVGVAVIDSGVGSGSAFGGRLVHVDLGDGPHADTFGHGTFVAAILGASLPEYSGIAPGVRVFDVNVSQDDGVYTSDVIAGLEWVRANHRELGIGVVNLSLIEALPSSHVRNPLDAAVERLWRDGVVVVVAAGNNGRGSAVYAPANDPYVITVGALDQGALVAAGDDFVAPFSADGPTLDGFAKPDLLAPGRRVVSILPASSALAEQAPEANVLGDDRYAMSGTSFAAPQVAGAAAILLARHPRWTPAQVKWVLTRTARPVPTSAAGALDLRRALTFRGRPRSANHGLPGAVRDRHEADDMFASASWSGNTWTGNTWTGNTWTGNTWTGNTWTGNTWTGNSWVGLVDPFQ